MPQRVSDLQPAHGLTLFVISHDLAVIRYLTDSIAVMYLGKLVEHGPAGQVYARPVHPYTRGLIATVPVADPRAKRTRRAAASPANCPPRSTRRPAAGSAPAAHGPQTSARSRNHRCACSLRAAIRSPVITR